MMHIRTQIISKMTMPAQAILIATRYSAVRRQFKTQQGTKDERQILNY
jgi:hypothetical protein